MVAAIRRVERQAEDFAQQCIELLDRYRTLLRQRDARIAELEARLRAVVPPPSPKDGE
jgi:hypothetical protein